MGRVGEYEMGKTIATGAFSKVKLVVHEATGKQYVAKILPKTNRDVENDIRVEIGILRRVRHDNVVQLIEILESPRNYYIILEPVLGGDLCTLVMKTGDGLDEMVAARLFSQLLNGVYACHKNGVAHRDLKPENILLTPDMTVKISDFGLSRLHKTSKIHAVENEYSKTLTGTLAYVAPEVLLGQYDAFRADLWSMGCILYVMLTCRFPFGSEQGKELENRIKRADIAELPRNVSPEAKELIFALLKANPKERPSLDEIAASPFLVEVMTRSFCETLARSCLVSASATGEQFEQVDVDDAGSPMAGSPTSLRPKPKRKLSADDEGDASGYTASP